jgi:fatty acid omega-hydroxylase
MPYFSVSPAEIQYILSTNADNYVKGKLSKSFDEIIGQSTFSTDGETWRFHRKITVSILNRDAVMSSGKILNQKLKRLESYLLCKEGQVVDFQEVSYKLILDVLFQWAFGLEVDQFNEDDGDIIFNGKNISEVIDAFDKLQLYTHQRFTDLFWQLKQKFCIGEREKNVKKCKTIMDDFCLGLIQETRQRQKNETGSSPYSQSNASDREDIISRFLRYKEKGNSPCSDKELRDFCMGFLLAGRDTTAAALAWCLYELTKHPAWILSLREEVDELCGKGGGDWDSSKGFTVDSVNRMKVVHVIVLETLRLHSPAPDNYRFAVNNDKLPDGTEIPAGSLVMFSPYTINHSEHIWGETSDEFDPSRWMHLGEPSPSRFPTFGLGPRQCPGRTIGLMELKMALSFLVWRFDFTDQVGHDGDYEWRLVMSMKNGFPVRVSARK